MLTLAGRCRGSVETTASPLKTERKRTQKQEIKKYAYVREKPPV